MCQCHFCITSPTEYRGIEYGPVLLEAGETRNLNYGGHDDYHSHISQGSNQGQPWDALLSKFRHPPVVRIYFLKTRLKITVLP
jgi:hypothetical protein